MLALMPQVGPGFCALLAGPVDVGVDAPSLGVTFYLSHASSIEAFYSDTGGMASTVWLDCQCVKGCEGGFTQEMGCVVVVGNVIDFGVVLYFCGLPVGGQNFWPP